MFPAVKTFPTRDVNQLHPKVKELCLKFLAECKKAGLKIGVSQTYRSTAYQAQLKKKLGNGASTPGKSMHEFRCAFDIYVNIKGHEYDTTTLKKAGAIGEKLGLTWGGHFSNVDMPHFEYVKPWTREQIRTGKIPR